MSLSRKLFVNWHTRRRQRSDVSGSPDVVDRLTFAKYENAPLQIVIVEPDADRCGPNNFKRVDITDLALKAVINDTFDDPSPLAEQTSWTKNTSENTFTGYLNLSTAAMNSYVGSADKSPYFELQVTDSGGALVKVLTEVCNVVVGVAQTTTTAPDVIQRYPTFDEMVGICALRVMRVGETITWQDSNGSNRRVIGTRTDGTPQDDTY